MELSRNDTKMLQGLSVLAMVCLHLFCRDYNGLFTPLVFIGGIPFSFYIAQLCDFCVFGFAFCSGYGHTIQSENPHYYKRALKKLLPLILNYWAIVIIFSAVSCFIGNGENIPGSISKFILNMLTLDNSYNGAWWYMFAYIVIVLISPLLMKAVKKFHPVIVLGAGFVIYCVAYYIRFSLKEVNFSNEILNTTVNWALGKLGPLGMTLFEYLIGAECCKLKIFTRIYDIWKKQNTVLQFIVSVLLIVGMLFVRTKIVASLFVAPVTGSVIIMLFHFWKKPKAVQTFFLFVGKHSTNIWLTHMFFYSKIFVNLVYVAKYPVFIFALMLLIVICVSVILKVILKPVKKLIK